MIEWLKQQPDSSTPPEAGDTSTLTLHETIKANHVVLDRGSSSLSTKFSVSELSGSIVIASSEAKPTLSIISPGTDKPPIIFEKDDQHKSALFLSVSNEEYIAAASKDSIYLWNLVQNTPSVAFKLEAGNDWYLCAIGEKTVACVAEQPSPDGFTKIYTLNTDSEKFTISGTLRLKARGRIMDMCYVKIADGTPCLLLNLPWTGLVQSVEMVGGKVRWQVDQQKMGGSFRSRSICTDGSTVFILNARPSKLYLVSVEDGSVLTSISLHRFGIIYPGCVRLQGEHLYVGHLNQKLDTYCISKFFQPHEV